MTENTTMSATDGALFTGREMSIAGSTYTCVEIRF